MYDVPGTYFMHKKFRGQLPTAQEEKDYTIDDDDIG
jgi:hypothetical protein